MHPYRSTGLTGKLAFVLALGVSAINVTNAQQQSLHRAFPPALSMTKALKQSSAGHALLSGQATEYSHGDPTAEEQYTLELINRARANPTAEGVRLAETTDPEVVNNCQGWGVDQQSMKNIFANYPEQPPLAFNPNLITSARAHTEDMYAKNYQSHTGSDGSNPFQRMQRAGYTGFSSAAENVGAQAGNLWAGHCGFNIDWGNDDPGHRRAIMSYEGPVYTEIGVGIKIAPRKSNAGPIVITHNFGLKSRRFVLGVVYKDNNSNGFYDVGEGLSGIKITMSKGDFFATTSTSGGYAIPLDGVSGSVTVTAEGTALGGKASKSVTISNQNVKVDFTSALPGMVSLVFPGDQEAVDKNSISFRWMKAKGVTDYNFELAKDDKFTQIVSSLASTKDTAVPVNNLANGMDYFWRVRGKTSAGWGDFSPAYKFSVEIIPGVPSLVAPQNNAVVGTTSVTFLWNRTRPEATNYRFELSEEENFIETIKSDTAVTDTSYTVANLSTGKTYYWRVTAENKPLLGFESDAYSFTVKQLPARVVLAFEEKNFAPGESITLSWLKQAGATKYWVEVAADSLFTSILAKDSSRTDTSYTIMTSMVDGNYYWRVKAGNTDGWGGFSTTGRFSLGINSVETVDGETFRFVNYPNPAEGGTLVKFSLPVEETGSLEIFDSRGLLVERLYSGRMQAGENSYLWNTENVQSGVYYCRLSFRAVVSLRMITIVK